jgi:hypothetical protein
LKNILLSIATLLIAIMAFAGGDMVIAAQGDAAMIEEAGEPDSSPESGSNRLYADFYYALNQTGPLLSAHHGVIEWHLPSIEGPQKTSMPVDPVDFGKYQRTLFRVIISTKAP